jgi:1,4-dihydroxy-2-naphthoate octaprenyltransferase
MINPKLKYWIQASRLASQGYIFFPLLLGQALWFCRSGHLNWPMAGLTWLFGLVIQLFIVYANDVADAAIDRLNSTFTPFSGGSRVLADGKLTVSDLKTGVAVTVGLCLVIGGVLLLQGRPLAPGLILTALALLWLYSFPPVRLSYRGGGEFLQMIGVGLVLPLFGFYLQAGTFAGFPIRYLAVLLPLQLACAFSTTLPDEPSDRAGGKKTISVLFGIHRARQVVVALHIAAPLILAGVMLPESAFASLLRVVAVSIPAVAGMLACMPRATPGNRAMLGFVTFSILATLGLTAAMAIERFAAGM